MMDPFSPSGHFESEARIQLFSLVFVTFDQFFPTHRFGGAAIQEPLKFSWDWNWFWEWLMMRGEIQACSIWFRSRVRESSSVTSYIWSRNHRITIYGMKNSASWEYFAQIFGQLIGSIEADWDYCGCFSGWPECSPFRAGFAIPHPQTGFGVFPFAGWCIFLSRTYPVLEFVDLYSCVDQQILGSTCLWERNTRNVKKFLLGSSPKVEALPRSESPHGKRSDTRRKLQFCWIRALLYGHSFSYTAAWLESGAASPQASRRELSEKWFLFWSKGWIHNWLLALELICAFSAVPYQLTSA